MGWQEYPENDENCLPLTEDELKEFHMKTEQVYFYMFSEDWVMTRQSLSFVESQCHEENLEEGPQR